VFSGQPFVARLPFDFLAGRAPFSVARLPRLFPSFFSRFNTDHFTPLHTPRQAQLPREPYLFSFAMWDRRWPVDSLRVQTRVVFSQSVQLLFSHPNFDPRTIFFLVFGGAALRMSSGANLGGFRLSEPLGDSHYKSWPYYRSFPLFFLTGLPASSIRGPKTFPRL